MANHARTGNSVAVTIYGRTYHLRGDGRTERLGELAERVDRTMRDIADKTGTADTLKVAILAALNIADDAAKGIAPATLGTEERACLDRCIELVDAALVEPGTADGNGTENALRFS